MTLFEATILALVQGATEFLPVSSSAHLILVPKLLGWADQGLAFDVIVHVGTLTAVLAYFRRDLAQIIVHWFQQFKRDHHDPQGYARLGNLIILATIPTGLIGLVINQYLDDGLLRHPLVIAGATFVFALALWWADRYGKRRKAIEQTTVKAAMIYGLAQAVALIPGTSRSGITITAGLMLGFTREAAARFSFLMSIPIIVLAGGLKLKELIEQPEAVAVMPLVVGFVVSALSAYACIAIFMKLLERTGMGIYVIYRILLAAVLVWVFI
ncbi:undecaprenyl-diphosphate phosphatase [Suttonella sp. R2A3]|uniref:undecaprenyl-diphosphate phosphatase n=1 Tax=Suttonella sp. R2A3 TaxID=2908648 RepID=UPI001F359252|nr:undecaprenyl-diphosphate phosphatase [Suttonella sp. R2A3]UJF24044.1 undecaprenyl-diphosphate phosphatase [Suttonella sp. R2A3]